MKLSKAQQQRRREWLNDVLLDADGDGNIQIVDACVALLKLHPGQWDGHPAYAVVKTYKIDATRSTERDRKAPPEMEPTPDISDVLDALHELANAEALSGVPKLVAGWSGPPDKPYAPHPAQLGARLETTCGRIYKLHAALKKARTVLAQAQRSMDRD